MENIKIKAKDNLELDTFYEKAEKPKAVVVIVHGMVEHKERYEYLMSKLKEAGYTSIIADLRGHGKSINETYKLGHIGSIDMMVDDVQAVVEFVKRRNPCLDVYMFAHSMGSLIGREYIVKYDNEIKKLILSGTVAYVPGCWLGRFLAYFKSRGKGAYKYSTLLYRMSNEMKKTDDKLWLSYNLDNVERYKNDPLCSFKFTNFSNHVLFKMTHRTHKRFKALNPDLKILSISGADDRTTRGTKGVNDTLKHLIFRGYHDVKSIEFKDMKHEILQEDNKDLVIENIVEFYGE